MREFVAERRPSALVVTGLLCATAYLFVLGYAMDAESFDIWGALVVTPILFAITIPIATRLSRREADPRMTRLIIYALILKMFGALVRYFVAFSVYNAADAQEYHDWGRVLAPMFRSGDFGVDLGKKVIGTGFIDIVTGAVYTVTGATKLGGFLVFSWFGFWGLYFFYRAFCIAFPNGEHRRYAILIFFLPSLLFWPSSIGKESWIMLTLGLLAYGVARLLASMRGGIPLLVLGTVGTLMVRPHVAAIAMIALIAAYLLKKPRSPTVLAIPVKMLMLVVLLAGALVVLSQAESFLGVDRLDQESVNQVLDTTSTRSSKVAIGSTFEAVRPTNPVQLANAALAVIFRPWPFEAHNFGALVASLEGMIILGLTLTSLRRLANIPREMLRTPYVAFAVVYSGLFVFAFSSIGNFGNIARQRVQLFPLLLVLLCVPVRKPEPRKNVRPLPARQDAPVTVPV